MIIYEYKQHEHIFPFWLNLFPNAEISYDLEGIKRNPPSILISNTFADKHPSLDDKYRDILLLPSRRILLTHNPQFAAVHDAEGTVTLHPKWEHKWPRILPAIRREISTNRNGILYIGRFWQYKDYTVLKDLADYPIKLLGYDIGNHSDITGLFESYGRVSNDKMYEIIPKCKFLLPLIHPEISKPYYERVYSGLFSEYASFCIPMIIHKSVADLYGFPGCVVYENLRDGLDKALSLGYNDYSTMVESIFRFREATIEQSGSKILKLI